MLNMKKYGDKKMDEQPIKEESKLLMYMGLQGINKSTLSKMTGIPVSTLSRIINNEVKSVKMPQMEAIAKALNTTIYTLFELPNLNTPLSAALRPEEAGTQITKNLTEDESLLLYLYQTSSIEGRAKIINVAKHESFFTQREIFDKTEIFIDRHGHGYTKSTNESGEQKVAFTQLSLELQKTP